MHPPKDTEEPAGAENPPVAPAPQAPGFWRPIDRPNVLAAIGIFIALLMMYGSVIWWASSLWWAIEDIDGDVGEFDEQMVGKLRDIESNISGVRDDVKTLSKDVEYVKWQLDGAKNKGDVGKLNERMDGELGHIRRKISDVSEDVQYIKGQLDGAKNKSASHTGTPVAASQRVSSHVANW